MVKVRIIVRNNLGFFLNASRNRDNDSMITTLENNKENTLKER